MPKVWKDTQSYYAKGESQMTIKEILTETQAKIIARGENPKYSVEQHLRDVDLIEELTKLKIKYREAIKC